MTTFSLMLHIFMSQRKTFYLSHDDAIFHELFLYMKNLKTKRCLFSFLFTCVII